MGRLTLLGAGGSGTVAAAPVNTVAPVISGINAVGNILTTTDGTWTGSPSPTFTYWWKRDGVPVAPFPTPGATTYNLTQLDAGVNITCEVYATNPSGTASATSNSIFVYDADAYAFNTATATVGSDSLAINTFVINCKAANIWTKFKAIYPFIGSTSTSQKFNLKNPADTNAAFRLSFIGGWTHSSTGALPNGTNAYADTFLNDTSILTLNSTHLSFYSRTITTSTASNDIGNFNHPAQFAVTAGYTNLAISDMYNYNTGRVSSSNTDGRGFWLGSRTSSIVHKFYKNGNQLSTTNTGAAGTFLNRNIYLGAINGGTANYYSPRQYAFASIGDGLTDLEVQVFNQIVEQYQFALGRNINPAQSFYYNTAYNNETNAFLYSTQITDTTTQLATNTLVNDLKTAGLWTKMKAVYPFVGTTATQQKFNLVNSQDTDAAFRLLFSGGWTHSSNGALANGSNTFANTYLIPSANLTTNNTHLSVYMGTDTASGNKVEMGVGVGGTLVPIMLLMSKYTGNLSYSNAYNLSTNQLTVSNTDAKGFYIGSRTSSTLHRLYKNGTTIGTDTNANANTLPTLNMLVSALNSNGSVVQYSDRRFQFISIGDGLTATDATNFSTAVNTFQTTLGRNVY